MRLDPQDTVYVRTRRRPANARSAGVRAAVALSPIPTEKTPPRRKARRAPESIEELPATLNLLLKFCTGNLLRLTHRAAFRRLASTA